jgi:formylglycine-generating enzyme required for sulfatase activity
MFQVWRFSNLPAVGILVLLASGCGSEETMKGSLSFLDSKGEEVPREAVSIKVFDKDGIVAIRRKSRVMLGEQVIQLKGGESSSDFVDNYFSSLFDIVDSTPTLYELETDDVGLFDFSFTGGECLVATHLVAGDENPRWLRLISRNAIKPEGIDLNTGNQLKFGGIENFVSLTGIENQFKTRLGELGLVAEWKPKLEPKNLIYIPPGNFVMGSKEGDALRGKNETVHGVTITHGFWMGKYEVTNERWNAVWAITDFNSSEQKMPVSQVSHGKAQAFCWKLTESERGAGNLPAGFIYRLPTEAEWEYACRAGTSSVFSFGDDPASLSEYAWHQGNSRRIYHQVGTKTANAWGLHDMYGNVLEWCFDWYGDYPSFPVVNPLGALRGKGRVLRGGGYTSAESQCRSGSRDQWAPISRSFNVGFRVVLGCPL